MSTVAAPTAALQMALARAFPGLGLRAETESDRDFLVALYTSTRWQELAPVAWPEAAKRDFLAQQCRLQHAHYLQHYGGAEMLLLVADRSAMTRMGLAAEQSAAMVRIGDSEPVGRVYYRGGDTEIRLMDIALLPPYCGRGIGSVLLKALQTEASTAAIELNLHVEPNNPAQRLYQRLGFHLVEQRGIYDFLSWP